VPSKREVRADDALAQLKKRARLDERLLREPTLKLKDGQNERAHNSTGNGDAERDADEDSGSVAMSSKLQAAKVRDGVESGP
jgi:hypothetical protein